jgi:uncharacterized repeat protein (TIGR03803 family)
MQMTRFFFVALGSLFALAACSWQGLAPPGGQIVPGNSQHALGNSKGYQLIYSFPGGAGGSDPLNSLTFVDGVAYGTTYAGGDVSGCNCGAVFAGTTIIYTFKGVASQDGNGPRGDLLLVGKKLYGITGSGGRNDGVCASNPAGAGCGTVFEIDTSGNEHVVYRFKGGKDGEAPVAGLVSLDGVLYGVTAWGGVSTTCTTDTPSGCGVVFAIDSSGHEKVIDRFKGGSDGAYPLKGLTVFKGTLYGTTGNGGGACPYGPGCGTVFRVAPSGRESVLYAFKGGSDGFTPEGRLIAVDGSLYGSTYLGGCAHKCPASNGFGTIFKLSLSGSKTIVYRFRHWERGYKGTEPAAHNPAGDLVFLDNKLFGTTSTGGCFACEGTIYSATLGGTFKVLTKFGATSGNVQDPQGLALKPSTHALFGAARGGGSSGNGGIFQYLL